MDFIFVVYTNHGNIFKMKISRSIVGTSSTLNGAFILIESTSTSHAM